jgi:hypothetical protein
VTIDDALDLASRAEPVTITRGDTHWTGRVVGVVTRAALILQQEDGRRVTIVLDGADARRAAPADAIASRLRDWFEAVRP